MKLDCGVYARILLAFSETWPGRTQISEIVCTFDLHGYVTVLQLT